MPQQAIELILLRQLASYLSMPVFLCDHEGNLLYYNEPAETLIGRRFDEVGELPAQDLADVFNVTDENGDPVPAEEVPINAALIRHHPVHRRVRFRALDGVWRVIDVSAFPLEGQGGRHLGAVAMFWEPAS